MKRKLLLALLMLVAAWPIVAALTVQRSSQQVSGAQGVAPPAGGAFALVQSKTAASTTASTTHAITFDSAAVANNLLVVTIAADDYMASAPAGWTKVSCEGTDYTGVYIIYKVAAGGETGVTITIGSATGAAQWFGEFSGMATSTPLDVCAFANDQGGAGTVNTGTTATTAQNNELLVAVISVCDGGEETVNSWSDSFSAVNGTGSVTTSAGTNVRNGTATRQVSATGAYTATATISTGIPAGSSGVIASFKITTP